MKNDTLLMHRLRDGASELSSAINHKEQTRSVSSFCSAVNRRNFARISRTLGAMALSRPSSILLNGDQSPAQLLVFGTRDSRKSFLSPPSDGATTKPKDERAPYLLA